MSGDHVWNTASNLSFGVQTVNGGVSVPTGQSPEPVKAPKALIATQAVQIQAGWVGQIVVGEAIIWETEPCEDAHEAERKATRRVLRKFAKMLN